MHFIFAPKQQQTKKKEEERIATFHSEQEKSPLYIYTYTVDGHENKRLLALCIMQICARLTNYF